MREQAARVLDGVAGPRVGTITSYDADAHAVKVRLQPDDASTGWLPLGSQYVGNGWGLAAAPSIGDMVVVVFIDGRRDAGVVMARLYNDEDRPMPVPAGEVWLRHSSGSQLRFLADGRVELQSAAGMTIHSGADVTLLAEGSVKATVRGSMQAEIAGALTAKASLATINAPTTINGRTTINGETDILGNLSVRGKIEATGGATAADFNIGPLKLSNHYHGGVQGGSNFSHGPVPPP